MTVDANGNLHRFEFEVHFAGRDTSIVLKMSYKIWTVCNGGTDKALYKIPQLLTNQKISATRS